MEFYRNAVSPILDRLDSETMHKLAKDGLHLAEFNSLTLNILGQFAYGRRRFFDPYQLEVTLGEQTDNRPVHLDNPVMVGAGWDKTGSTVRGLYTLGFSGVEVGTITEHPQPGNPKPRQFYHPDGTALNRLGFNSPGMEDVRRNVYQYSGSGIPLGISLGKNKDVELKDAAKTHAVVAKRFRKDGYWFSINVSSPNTLGLRTLQDKEPLTDIAQAVKAELIDDQPIFVKIAPDLSYQAIDDVIQVVLDNRLSGIIAANTTVDTDLKTKYGWGNEAGGLSGNDEIYFDRVQKIIAHIYRQAGGKMDIIGAGGINSYIRAEDMINAGANALQVVTGIREIGPTLPGRINRGLVKRMKMSGFKNISEMVGKAAYTIPH